MSDKGTTVINFMPSATLISIVLAVLKLTGNIDISWWWIFSPIWLPIAIAVAIMLVLLLIIIFAQIIAGLLDR